MFVCDSKLIYKPFMQCNKSKSNIKRERDRKKDREWGMQYKNRILLYIQNL